MSQLFQSVDGAAAPRVLMLLSNRFDPDPRVYNEARTLVKHGYQVSILAWDRDRKCPEREVMDGIAVERIFLSSRHGRGFSQLFVMPVLFWLMIKKALRLGFDVVHAHDFDTLPAGFLLSRIKNKPLIYDSHEDYAGMLHGSIPLWLEQLIRWIESKLVRRVDALFTVGETLRKEFEIRGCPRAQTLGNWKLIEDFRLPEQLRAQMRVELKVPKESILVSYISNLGKERHIEELLEAVSRRPQIYLVVGGNGPVATTVQEYAKRCGNIRYVGFVPPADIPRYTSACDIVYYGYDPGSPNARFSAPNKLFEGLAAGRPLLTAKFGEIGRIVSDHGCGVILSSYSVEEILCGLDLCSVPEHLKELKDAAARAGENQYNWHKAEHVLLSVYNELLSGAQRDRVSPEAA
ncbi:MAG TPA: glycosyltransferase family 4 protein [Candidatus Angelobacter sp.]|nr:glycosyltransferase family 4 protein [Candidatus Angelobacter sp.]